MKKTRKQAAKEIYELQKSMEAKPYSESTVYKRIFHVGDVWRMYGCGYDYTA